MADPFTNLQNGFYNEMTVGLGMPTGAPFQLLQPSAPIVLASSASAAQEDQALWQYLNILPAYSLTGEYVATEGDQFFSNYSSLLSNLAAEPNTLIADIGQSVHDDFMTYVLKISPLPTADQLSQLFLNWAALAAPDVADVGAADYAQIALDTVASGQINLLGYGFPTPHSPKLVPPGFSQSYADLLAQLKVAPSRSFDLHSSSMNSSVSQSWTSGSDDGFLGLWGGSSSSSSTSQSFASSSVEVKASFAHVTTFQAAPGPWYSSGAMADAFNHDSAEPPWKPAATETWADYFDPDTGAMGRFAVSLVVADQIDVTVTAKGTFTSSDVTDTQSNYGNGMWPFYSSNGNQGTHTDLEVCNESEMKVRITSDPNTPIVLGCNVLPVAQFVGHSVEAARALRVAHAELAGAPA